MPRCRTHQDSQRTFPYYRTQIHFLKSPRESIATGACPTVDQHYLWAIVAFWRPGKVFAVSPSNIIECRTVEHLQEAVRQLAPGIKTFIDNKTFLINLPIELPQQFSLPLPPCVGHVQVSKLAIGGLIDFPAMTFNPLHVSQSGFL